MDISPAILYNPFKMDATLQNRFFFDTIRLSTARELDVIDITDHLQKLVSRSGITDGLAHLFVAGSTAALTTIEFEPGAVSDLREALDRAAPHDIAYRHNERWGDGNGHSHIRAALLGPDIAVPVRDALPLLGTWQQVILIELDVRARERTVHVTITGRCGQEGAAP